MKDDVNRLIVKIKMQASIEKLIEAAVNSSSATPDGTQTKEITSEFLFQDEPKGLKGLAPKKKKRSPSVI